MKLKTIEKEIKILRNMQDGLMSDEFGMYWYQANIDTLKNYVPEKMSKESFKQWRDIEGAMDGLRILRSKQVQKYKRP